MFQQIICGPMIPMMNEMNQTTRMNLMNWMNLMSRNHLILNLRNHYMKSVLLS